MSYYYYCNVNVFLFLCFTMVLNDIWLQRPAKRGQQSKLVTASLAQGPAGVEMLIPSALKVRSYEIHLQADSGRKSTVHTGVVEQPCTILINHGYAPNQSWFYHEDS